MASTTSSEPKPSRFRAGTVSLHALSSGHFTLPEYQFLHPVARDARKTVPSLAFLIQHQGSTDGKVTRIVFDLGLRRDIERYSEPIRQHVETRRPLTTEPDVVKSLAKGGLTPEDIDYVVYSHVHWDHIGEPRDFPTSTFVVGHGASALLKGASSSLRGGHSFFEEDLLPEGRFIELANPGDYSEQCSASHSPRSKPDFKRPWRRVGRLPQTIDLFDDGSVYVVNAPGHLPGHINILAHTHDGRRVYLGGDACHDRRLLTGEKQIGEWQDAHGQICCVHADRQAAEATIERIRELERDGVEIILAHDDSWEDDPKNRNRFFGSSPE